MPPIANSLVRLWTNRRVQSDGSEVRVLVVDENRNAAEAIATFLLFENMVTRAAFGGMEAIAAALEWWPHVIVMDNSMPEYDGFEAVRSSMVSTTIVNMREIKRLMPSAN
jgi:two-component system OmpR family response regulator